MEDAIKNSVLFTFVFSNFYGNENAVGILIPICKNLIQNITWTPLNNIESSNSFLK